MAKAEDRYKAIGELQHDSPDWSIYLQDIWSKEELEKQLAEDYGDEISDIIQREEGLIEFLEEEIRETRDGEQLMYDFGRSLAEAGLENDVDLEDVYADSLALQAFMETKSDSRKIPNPQYAIRGMTDFMAQTEEYGNMF